MFCSLTIYYIEMIKYLPALKLLADEWRKQLGRSPIFYFILGVRKSAWCGHVCVFSNDLKLFRHLFRLPLLHVVVN